VKKRSALIWLLPLALVAILVAFQFDQPLAQAIADVSPRVKKAAVLVSWFGKGGVILYPTGLLILLGMFMKIARPDREDWLDPILRALIVVFVIVAAAGLADDVLKVIFGRARPFMWLMGDTSGFHPFRFKSQFNSFPSGHTTTSFAAAVAFSALFPRLRVVFFLVATAIGISRIMQDVHYLSDVIAGAALGMTIAILVLPAFRKRNWAPYWRSRSPRPKPVIITNG
jgi:membrane-associated phospholipid phosphatase